MNARWVLASLLAVGPLAAQGTLDAAARGARAAWLAHDVQALVPPGVRVVLQIPGADPSSPLGRAQAIELLRRYLRATEERGLTVRTVREVEAGRGFVELERHFVVAGTTELRRETLFFGFQRDRGRWLLSEVRSAP